MITKQKTQMENLKKYKNHLSSSAYKSLQECSARQVAIDLGLFEKPTSKEQLIGKYVDAYFSGTIDELKKEDLLKEKPQIFKKDGSLYADFITAETVIKVIENDPLLLKYVKGDKLQYKVRGEIGGVIFEGFIDSLHTDKAIVDLKIMADLYAKFWDNKEKSYVLWFEYFGYDRQMAIYQELIYQETGKKLPCFLAVATKQTPPDKAVIQIPQGRMDLLIDEIKDNAMGLVNLRNGTSPVVRCEKCDYCRSTKMLKETITVFDLM